MTMPASNHPHFTGLYTQALPALVTILSGRRGAGAGFVWGAPDLILTNNHVALRDRLDITFIDGRTVEGRVAAREKEIDLALVRIPPQDISPLCSTDLDGVRPGQVAVALGHPLGHRNHLSVGVISSIDTAQTRGDRGLIPVVRTDLVLLPGNSGGPLLDAGGCVIGVNTMVVGGDQGYAIPVALAAPLLSKLDSNTALEYDQPGAMRL